MSIALRDLYYTSDENIMPVSYYIHAITLCVMIMRLEVSLLLAY